MSTLNSHTFFFSGGIPEIIKNLFAITTSNVLLKSQVQAVIVILNPERYFLFFPNRKSIMVSGYMILTQVNY